MRKILLTGSTSGMGIQIIRALSDGVDEFFLHYLSEEGKKEIENEVSNLSFKATFYRADLTDTVQTRNMVEQISKIGGVDIIIHCVSPELSRIDISKKSWSDFERHMSLQVRSLFMIIKGLIGHMKDRKRGKIINILSEAVIGKPPSNLSDYVTSKYALLGFSKSLAVEYGQSNITCNCISPGLIDTALTADYPNKLKELVSSQTPLKRITKPEDVASLIKFLCSDDADFITGENILVNGGFLMN